MADQGTEEVKFLNKGEMQINFKGNFDLAGLYKMLYFWLTGELDYKGVQDKKNIEDYYMEMKLPGGTLTNHWIWWRLKKDEGSFSTKLNIDFQTLALSEKEVLNHGKKHKVMSGEIKIFINVKSTYDVSAWHTNSLFSKLFYKLKASHHDNIVSQFKVEMYEELFEIADRIKMAFGMYQTYPLDRPFTEPNAYPQQTR